MSQKEKILLFLLAAINFTHILDFMIMMPLNPQLSVIFNINQQQFSLLVSSYTFSAFLSGIIAAFFVDGFDRKKVLLFGYAGFIIGTIGCAVAPSYHILLIARIVAGLFGGLISAQVLSIVGDNFSYERRATAMSFLTSAFSVASVVGVPLGLYLATLTSWHAPFLLVGCAGVVIFFMVIKYVPNMADHLRSTVKRKPSDAFVNVYKSKNQQRALLLSITMMIGHFSIIPFIAKYLVTNVGFSNYDVSLVYLIGGGATIFTAPLVGMIADKKGKFPVFAVMCCLCLIPVFLITNMPPISIFLALAITTLFFIFVSGRMIPMQAMVTSVVTPQQRGGFMSINSSLIQLGSGLAALIAGTIIFETPEHKLIHYDYVGYMGMAATIICIFIARKLKMATQEPATDFDPLQTNQLIPAEQIVIDQAD